MNNKRLKRKFGIQYRKERRSACIGVYNGNCALIFKTKLEVL